MAWCLFNDKLVTDMTYPEERDNLNIFVDS